MVSVFYRAFLAEDDCDLAGFFLIVKALPDKLQVVQVEIQVVTGWHLVVPDHEAELLVRKILLELIRGLGVQLYDDRVCFKI